MSKVLFREHSGVLNSGVVQNGDEMSSSLCRSQTPTATRDQDG